MFYVIGSGTGIVSFFVGYIWYTAVFGKAWQRLMGFTDEKVKSIFVPKRIIVAVISELVASLCMVGILYNLNPYKKPQKDVAPRPFTSKIELSLS